MHLHARDLRGPDVGSPFEKFECLCGLFAPSWSIAIDRIFGRLALRGRGPLGHQRSALVADEWLIELLANASKVDRGRETLVRAILEHRNFACWSEQMTSRFRLRSMNDAELVAALPRLASRESEHTAHFLAHLAELDERRLFLELGFRSMREYCTVALKICETSAWRRITAARVCRQFPEAFALVAKGELQLSVLAALSKRVTPSNACELFEACRGPGESSHSCC